MRLAKNAVVFAEGLQPEDIAHVNFSTGLGAPVHVSGKGSLYTRQDGSSASTRLYVNSDGGTTWVAVTTAS